MSTTAELRTRTKADLAKMAKSLGISGCSAMLKDELVTAVAKAERAKTRVSKNGKTSSGKAKPQASVGMRVYLFAEFSRFHRSRLYVCLTRIFFLRLLALISV